MKKLMIALVAGCMSVAFAGAYAATGSPADSDKAGRMGPGSAAGEAGASDPNAPSKAKPMKGGAASSAATTGAGGASASTSAGGSSAAAGGAMEEKKGTRSRRARAAKG